jgi:hypothetical protein
MKFDTPATNPIDQLQIIGRPAHRIDGPLKTTGTAPYAYERHDVAPDAAYGYVIGSAIAKGRIASISASAARSAPGVLAVVTTNSQQLGQAKRNPAKLFGGSEIFHYHQAVALVVAETFEQARSAAQLVRIDYTPGPGVFSLLAAKDTELLESGIRGDYYELAGLTPPRTAKPRLPAKQKLKRYLLLRLLGGRRQYELRMSESAQAIPISSCERPWNRRNTLHHPP